MLSRDSILNQLGEISVEKFNAVAENEGSIFIPANILINALSGDFDMVTHEYGRFNFSYIVNHANKTALLPLLQEVVDVKYNGNRGLYADLFDRTLPLRATYGIHCFMLNYPNYSLTLPIGFKYEHCALFIKRDEKRKYKMVVFNPIPFIKDNIFSKFLNNFRGRAKRYTGQEYDSSVNCSAYTWREIYNFMVFNKNPLVAPHDFDLVAFERKVGPISV